MRQNIIFEFTCNIKIYRSAITAYNHLYLNCGPLAKVHEVQVEGEQIIYLFELNKIKIVLTPVLSHAADGEMILFFSKVHIMVLGASTPLTASITWNWSQNYLRCYS